MSTFSTVALLAASLLLADSGDVTQLEYKGQLVQTDRNGDRVPVKEFEIHCLVTEQDGEPTMVFFQVEEDRRTAMPWPERFGQRLFSATPVDVTGPAVRVLYVHDERPALLSLPVPLFQQPSKLADEAEWTEGEARYTVIRSREIKGQTAWQVNVSPSGRSRSYTVDVAESTGIILSGFQRLTLGQGDLFELTWELVSQNPLESDVAERAAGATDALLALQASLNRDEDDRSYALSPAQLDLAEAALENLQSLAAETPFEQLATVIARDVRAQKQRAASVADLAQQMVGKEAPEFTLTELDRTAVDPEQYAGKTVVLHFWDYRNEVLETPYGQVGYLDFLSSRHEDDNVVVYGVSTDPRLRAEETAGAARRSIRKLKDFMNLSYEIVGDHDGSVLKAFGDPTRFDEELPLWVVIGPEGTVIHYKTGFYEVDRDRGLLELDEVVTEAAR
ncbi:MAG: TlpA family protein disulfide reductase [Planctomycetota bacterium]|nr:MAG: TlpA family protein disulfide reductase [Planctomycetota bacterium]